MDYILVAGVTLLGAGLTLFSGFGLGTLLMPVFALFFPVESAIAMTAVVHLANNLIKLGFFFRNINWSVVIKFGIPSVFAAFLGAHLLSLLSNLAPVVSYSIGSSEFTITPVKLIVGVLLLLFSVFELSPKLAKLQFDKKFLSLGGALSGFFGGLSGNQGALRSAFLVKANLSKEVFIGTGVVIASFIDITRLSVYSDKLQLVDSNIMLLVVAVASAFLGVFFGNKLVKKVTIHTLQQIVGALLFVFAVLLVAGIL